MSIEGIMLSCMIYTCMIDAMEGWDVVTDEIPRALLQTDYDRGDIHINILGVNGDSN